MEDFEINIEVKLAGASIKHKGTQRIFICGKKVPYKIIDITMIEAMKNIKKHTKTVFNSIQDN